MIAPLATALFVGGFALALAAAVSTARATRSFAPWVPSSRTMLRRALDYIKPKSHTRFIDLGCGDGRMVMLAHAEYGLAASGCELSFVPYLVARLRQLRRRNKGTVIEKKDLYDVDLRPFGIIYMYGLPETLSQRLSEKLEREVSRGTFVVSYNFSLPRRTSIVRFQERWRTILIYRW